MHELTVAGNIISIVASAADEAGIDSVHEVLLEIGLLAGVEYDSLDFALGALTPGTVMEKAAIMIEKPGGAARCLNCGKEFAFESFIGCCEACRSVELQIISGNELRVKSISI
jgi:hydrogenase nickel incorporation protein HypA/HybF